MALRIYLIRHGESEVNAAVASRALYTGRNTWSELTDRGIAEARAIATSIEGICFDACFASSTVRAQQTARYCLEAMGCQWSRFEVRTELAEIDHGAAEGTAKIRAAAGDEPPDYWRFVPDGGRESLKDVAERVTAWTEREVLGHPDWESVAVFTHENVIKCLLIRLFGLPFDALYKARLPNGALVVVGRDDGQWRLLEAPPDILRLVTARDPSGARTS